MRRTPMPAPSRVREQLKYMVQYFTLAGTVEPCSSVHSTMNLVRTWDMIALGGRR